ncbi:tyrosine-type recombinase/integrase [Alicyclobacillus dauci]|uniref:Tyrosine-type recombinase/integrase n=1 Tax=Alicyclobacillus dauci TaxID=1475485 RepID=A0ABY6Z0R0_9BACL|nr:tyrosine-type recombinase/integrase [Alicyclobacillus dauci]WAH36458.1 tyrosine-type recombinase/integrase [Alicyclobacillus dauci]
MSRFKTDVKIDVFTDYHIRQMLLYYRSLRQRDKTFYAYRDSTIIGHLLGTGIRVGELANLRWHDVDFEHDTITVFGKKRIMGNLTYDTPSKAGIC